MSARAPRNGDQRVAGESPPEGFEVQPARRWRLSDLLDGQLLKQIVEKELPEGRRLPSEAEISQMFGASRPVVREALKRLQTDGLVYARKGAGSFVRMRPPTRLTEFAEPSAVPGYLRCNEARMAIEGEAARLAATRRTRDQLARIRQAMDAMVDAFAMGEPGIEQDVAFHKAIAEASDNELFPRLLGDLAELMRGSMAMGLGLTRIGSDLRRELVLTEHQQIVDAIAAQDAEAAGLYMRFHLTQSRLRTIDAREPS